MVDGTMVYLKYFQKSNRALRLNSDAKASSVEGKRACKLTSGLIQIKKRTFFIRDTHRCTKWASR